MIPFALGAVAGFGLAILVGWVVGHRHKMVIVSSHKANYGHPDLFGGECTSILWRCGCGEVKRTVMDGHWSLEELTCSPSPIKKDEELAQLKRVAGLSETEGGSK